MNIGTQSGLKKIKLLLTPLTSGLMKTAPLVTFRGRSDEACTGRSAVEVAGKPCVVMMHMMAGISLKELGERVADLTNSSASLRDALDFLISGY